MGIYDDLTKLEDQSPPSKYLKKKQQRKEKAKTYRTKKSRNRDTMKPRNHDTTVSRYHATIIESVRRAVKEIGKEAATHRFTQEEKKAIADIIYAYKNRGTKTSENQITRISVNFILNDYRENGENSVLNRALKALNT